MNFKRWDDTWWDVQRNASGRIERIEWKELRRKVWTEFLRKSTTKESSCCGPKEKHLKTWGETLPQANVSIAEKNEEMQNSTSEENEELFALQDARRKDTWTPPTRSWWTLEGWIKSWRTTMENSGKQKRWRDTMKDERIKLMLAMI